MICLECHDMSGVLDAPHCDRIFYNFHCSPLFFLLFKISSLISLSLAGVIIALCRARITAVENMARRTSSRDSSTLSGEIPIINAKGCPSFWIPAFAGMTGA